MNKSLIVYIVYSFCIAFAYTQVPITFDKSLNGEGGGRLFELPNRYEVFYTYGFNSYARSITDKEGNQLSMQQYGGVLYEFLWDAFPSPDGGHVMSGHSFSFPLPDSLAAYFAYIVKIDSSGNFQWQQVFNFPTVSERQTTFYNGAATSDGGYIFAGSSCCDSIFSPTDWYRPGLYVVKTDSLGNKEWEILDTTLTESYYENTPIKESPLHDGYYIATNYIDSILDIAPSFPRCDKYFLIKTDLQGNYLWTKGYYPTTAYDPEAYYSFKDILVTDHNTLILLGSGMVMETDLNGNEIWRNEHTFGYTIRGRIHKVPWGGYITSQGDLIHYIADDGTIIWEKQYANIASFRDIIPTQDGGFLALIQQQSGGGGRLVKMDCEGNVINPVSCATGIENPVNLLEVEIDNTEEAWNIKKQIENYTLTDITLADIIGNRLGTYYFVENTLSIPKSGLEKGFYLLVLQDAKGNSLKIHKVLNY